MSSANHETMRSVFASTLDIDLITVTDELSYNSIPEWDSVAHMALIAVLEDRFGIMLDTNDIIDMSSVKVAKDILSKHGVQF